MFGKSRFEMDVAVGQEVVMDKLKIWSKKHKLKEQKPKRENTRLYRFGNPYISNPIYIEVNFSSNPLAIEGWVQSLIPWFRWKLIDTSNANVGTIVDYRRKGGFFCLELKKLLTSY